MTKHICIDRILPQSRFELKNRFLNDDRSRAAYQFNKLWPNGSTLRIAFLSGTQEQKEFVKTHAIEWTKYANLTFVFDADPIDSEIRITFVDEGSWSYIGKDCLNIPKDQPTMNFGWLDTAVVLHEFGHCLSGDTLIDCPRDLEKYPTGIPIKELVGKQPWVYAWHAGRIVVRKASRVWLSKKMVKTVRVRLGTGQGGRRTRRFLPPLELVGTPDHPVLLADGKTWKSLGDLQPKDRLCSLYRQGNGTRSRISWTGSKTKDNTDGRVREHVFVCEQVYGKRPDKHDCHHKNERMLDQSPENLEWKHESEHCRDHSTGRKISDAMRRFLATAWKGRKHTAESKAKMAKARQGKPISEETKAKMSARSKGKRQSPALVEKRAEGIRRFYTNGGRSGMFGKKATEETRQKQSESLKRFYENEGQHALAGKKFSIETRAKQSEGVKAWHARKKEERAVNHVVISVEPADVQDVYDITVPGADSFIANGVVVHNSMGLIHEHQNPEGGIQWDRQAVINDLKGPPNYWDEATIEHNLFKTYDRNQLNYTQLDPQSIMLYPIPDNWTTDCFNSGFNQTLSEMDKQFAGDARNYPKAKPNPITTLPVVDAQGFAATIGQPGEEDLYTFAVKEPGRYVMETFGGLDLVMSLLGPDNQTLQITQDDDSGFALNAKIIKDLIPGKYWIQVRHYNLTKGQGEYNIRVTLL